MSASLVLLVVGCASFVLAVVARHAALASPREVYAMWMVTDACLLLSNLSTALSNPFALLLVVYWSYALRRDYRRWRDSDDDDDDFKRRRRARVRAALPKPEVARAPAWRARDRVRDIEQAHAYALTRRAPRYHHDTTALTCPFTGRQVLVDDGIVDDVLALWAAGVRTTVSCEGEEFSRDMARWCARYVGLASASDVPAALDLLPWVAHGVVARHVGQPDVAFLYSAWPDGALRDPDREVARVGRIEVDLLPVRAADEYTLS